MNHKARMLPPAAKQNQKSKFFFWPAGIAVILIAFFFRFYRLADHPLGIFFDPAINGLDAVRLMQRGGPVIFFPTNGGREALFIYLLMIPIWLFGAIPFSMRALTAAFGLLTVVCLFAWLAHLRHWPEENGYQPPLAKGQADPLRGSHYQLWFATLAGLALATSYWHIAVSRLGQRPIMVAMLSVPLFWFFLKGWATGQKRWFVLAGLFMGLEGHTYSAARLLPVILAITLLPEFIPGFRSFRLNYRQVFSNLFIFFLVAALIYLPMAWYLLTHPAQFTERASSVMVWNFLDTPAAILAEFGRNLVRVAGFFCCAGSPNPIFGWPNYPGSSPILLPFLLFGLLIALKNWRNLFQRLVIIWWLVGLLPSIAAIEAPHPWRMINGAVPTAILIALGLLHTSHLLPITNYHLPITHPALRITHYVSRFTFYVLPTRGLWLRFALYALLLLPLPGLFRAYFLDWTRLESTQGIYDYGAVAIRDAVLDQAGQNIPIYLPLSRFGDSTLLYYLSGHFQRQATLSVPASESSLLISPEKNMADTTWVRLHQGQATLLPPLTQTGRQRVRQALSDPSAQLIRTAAGEIAARQQLLADDPARFIEKPLYPLEASFGPVRLIGATYSKTIDPQAPLPVTLFWQANQTMSSEYEVLLRLVDDSRRAWGNGDGRPAGWVYPTSFWRPGLDTVAAQQSMIVESPQLEPGRYWLAVSMFDSSTARRLPLTAGPPGSPDTLYLGPLKVPLPKPDHLPEFPPRPVITFGEAIRLEGFAIDNHRLTAGEAIQLTLLWHSLVDPVVDYTVFVHLLDKNGNLVAGNDMQPLNNRYPTTIWTAGEEILDVHTVPTPADLAPGQYRLAIGLYQAATGERLPLFYPDGGKDSQGRLVLEPAITVTTGS